MIDITLEELLEAGCHFGHQTKRWNPKMASYIYGEREGIHIFDLAKTREALLSAVDQIEDTVKSGGQILLVGTKKQAKDLVRDIAEKTGMPYVDVRWLGGTLTNFEQIKKTLRKLLEMKAQREEGTFKKYTKKERLLFDREIARMERLFGGLSPMTDLPKLVFITDVHKESTAVAESRRLGIPVIGIVDTNADPTGIDYPIPGNDDAVKSVSLLVGIIGKGIEEGLKMRNVKSKDQNDKSKS